MKTNIENIVIFGAGAAGGNVFMNLLYTYPDMNYTIVDFDKVELRNIEPGTQPYTRMDLNRPKTQAIQRIAMALKKKKINPWSKKIKTIKDIQTIITDHEKTLIIDAFDNAKSRNLFLNLGKEYNVLHIGFSKILSGEVIWNNTYNNMSESKSDKEIDICEMSLARSFIFALTSLATIIITNYLEQNLKTNIYFDKFLKIKTF